MRNLSSAPRLGVTLLALAGLAGAQPARPPQGRGAPEDFANVEIHTLKTQGNVFMLLGAGGNISVQVGKDGVLLVDAEYPQLSDKILAAIRRISDGPIRYIVNTHYHADHTSPRQGGRHAAGRLADRHLCRRRKEALV